MASPVFLSCSDTGLSFLFSLNPELSFVGRKAAVLGELHIIFVLLGCQEVEPGSGIAAVACVSLLPPELCLGPIWEYSLYFWKTSPFLYFFISHLKG